METLAESLLADVKNYLDITWDDPGSDRKLCGIISRGMAYVQRLTARPLNFAEGTPERQLLFEYCLYARSGALSDFAANYLTDINNFMYDEELRHYRAAKSSAEHEGADGDA